jgi:hypothetical protein
MNSSVLKRKKWNVLVRGNGATEEVMADGLDRLRKAMPDLVHKDPLSTEVREWLDRAYDAVTGVDEIEGVILRVHQQLLFNSAEKATASAEIARTIDRAARVSSILHRLGVPHPLDEH